MPTTTDLTRLRIMNQLGEEIGRAVSELYTQVAADPQQGFHFPTGPQAARTAGYAQADLDRVPDSVLQRFAGVGCPLDRVRLDPGSAVLDIGCGAGTDLIIAAARVGPTGRAVGIELTEPMANQAQRALEQAGLEHATVQQARVPSLPVDGPFDVVTSNGVLNLVPEKERTLERIHEVLASGGRVSLADIVLTHPPSTACLMDTELWAECLVGAYTEEAYLAALEAAGFVDIEVHERRDYFRDSPSSKTRETAEDLGAFAWELTAQRP